ncbi:hypothetical protein J6590_012562 [Homalodisca vitripennis]|nr:hypothetical protein J6590_012562 [Homalodisca vitripennis]
MISQHKAEGVDKAVGGVWTFEPGALPRRFEAFARERVNYTCNIMLQEPLKIEYVVAQLPPTEPFKIEYDVAQLPPTEPFKIEYDVAQLAPTEPFKIEYDVAQLPPTEPFKIEYDVTQLPPTVRTYVVLKGITENEINVFSGARVEYVDTSCLNKKPHFCIRARTVRSMNNNMEKLCLSLCNLNLPIIASGDILDINELNEEFPNEFLDLRSLDCCCFNYKPTRGKSCLDNVVSGLPRDCLSVDVLQPPLPKWFSEKLLSLKEKVKSLYHIHLWAVKYNLFVEVTKSNCVEARKTYKKAIIHARLNFNAAPNSCRAAWEIINSSKGCSNVCNIRHNLTPDSNYTFIATVKETCSQVPPSTAVSSQLVSGYQVPPLRHNTSAFVYQPSTADQRPIASGNRHGRKKQEIKRKGDRNEPFLNWQPKRPNLD